MASTTLSSSHRRGVSSTTTTKTTTAPSIAQHTSTETSPLLVVSSSAKDSFLDNVYYDDDDDDDDNAIVVNGSEQHHHHHHRSRGQASFGQTILNLMKTCMGTGTLALAFACQQGGTVLFVVGMFALAVWNIWGVHLLVQCLPLMELLLAVSSLEENNDNVTTSTPASIMSGTKENMSGTEEMVALARSAAGSANSMRQPKVPATTTASSTSTAQHPPRGTSTLGRVAWYALGGDTGRQVLDVMMVLLLMGIVVAYISAVVSFVRATPLSVLGTGGDALLLGGIMACLSLVPDMGYLSNASAVGLFVLFAAFVVIAGYGLLLDHKVDTTTTLVDEDTTVRMNVWPQSLSGVSHWFGICVFGYGIVPLTYNLQESMKEPHRFVGASALSLLGVALSYIALGVGLYALFPHLTADVLSEIPDTGLLPIVTRLAMTSTVVATAPLLIVPCAELLEGKLSMAVGGGRTVVRFAVVLTSVGVAVLLPGFVQVLSLVGCFCVATVSFILPPLLHWRLLVRVQQQQSDDDEPRRQDTTTPVDRRRLLLRRVQVQVWLDVALLVWGIIATVITSIYSLRSLLSS